MRIIHGYDLSPLDLPISESIPDGVPYKDIPATTRPHDGGASEEELDYLQSLADHQADITIAGTSFETDRKKRKLLK